MIRKIITIDDKKCNGCGLCIKACHEGAIGVVNGKAKLLRDDYCDGLGNCLPVCPKDAISFEEREAAAFDEYAVERNSTFETEYNIMEDTQENVPTPMVCGCSGMNVKNLKPIEDTVNDCMDGEQGAHSALRQWPVQIKLLPVNAPYFENAHLLLAADCTAYAYGDFHKRFIKNRVVLVGCPKLDDIDYAEKLMEILRKNEIKSITVVRMEVPCCSGLENAVKRALVSSGKMIPWHIHVIGLNGKIIEEY